MTSVGFIRWPAAGPAQRANTLFVRETPTVQTSYAHRQPKNGWSFNGLSTSALQAQVDKELTWCAAAGGTDVYMAYGWYPHQTPPNIPEKVISESYFRHVASPLASSVKFTLILIPAEGPRSGGMALVNKQVTTYWRSVYVPWFVSQMQLPNWKTVTVNGVVRPLIFVFDGFSDAQNFGSTSSAQTEFQYLRDQCVAAGLNTPYMVDVKFGAANVGCDAVSGYNVFNGTSYGSVGWNGHLSWERARQGDVLQRTSIPSGKHLVPSIITAADPRPRSDANVSDPTNFGWANFYNYYADHPTYREWENHLRDTVEWVQANPTLSPANTVLAGCWDEFEESGPGAVPFLPSDTSGKGFLYLNAIKAVLLGRYPATYVNSYNGDSLNATTTGTWVTSAATASNWQNDVIYTQYTNDSWAITDRAYGYEWVAIKGTDRGIAEVLIDGVSQGTVDLYAAATSAPVVVWSKFGLSAGNHTLTIKHTGTKNVLNTGSYSVVVIDVVHVTCKR